MSRGIPAINEDVFAKCQVYTPDDIVQHMLDMANYKRGLMGKPVLESSFGDGSILAPIVERYINDAVRSNYSTEQVRLGLQRDIVGYEIDDKLISQVHFRLDAIAEKYGVYDVRWNLLNEDSLCIDTKKKFKYIIGNPPYLEAKAIRTEVRNQLRASFESCKRGKFDYCYAFLEKGLSLLSEDGVMVQLVPSSIMSNLSAQSLRNLLLDGIAEVVTFSSGNVFDSALVSPCIIRYEKGAANDCIAIAHWNKAKQLFPKPHKDTNWTSVYASANPTGTRFGDFFSASMPIATLCNDAFLLHEDEIVEEALMRKAACPRQLRAGKEMNIIFPYLVEVDGTIRHIGSSQFEESFPLAANHLSRHKSKLASRKSDQSAQWFEYGRSQGIALVDSNTKLMLSTVISDHVNVYEIPEGVVPYGGIVISSKQDASLELAKSVLTSDEFLAYARAVGTKVSGSSVRITSRQINNYRYNVPKDSSHDEEKDIV